MFIWYTYYRGSVCAGVRGQFTGVLILFLLYGSWGLELGTSDMAVGSLTTESSCQTYLLLSLLQMKMKVWRYSPVGKVLALQAREPELDPLSRYFFGGCGKGSYGDSFITISVLKKLNSGAAWPANQSSLPGKFQPNQSPITQKKRLTDAWGKAPEVVLCPPPHTHTPAHTLWMHLLGMEQSFEHAYNVQWWNQDN